MKKTDEFLRITALLLFLLLFLSGCSKCTSDNKNEDYETEKRYMISSLDQKDNFSRLVETNIKTIDGKKYEVMRLGSKAVLEYQTGSTENMLPLEVENTGKAHLTANKKHAYIMMENGENLLRIDIENKTQRSADLAVTNTDISLSSDNNYVFLYSKEKGLLILDNELENFTSINLRDVQEIEGEISELFLSKSSRGLMFMGSNFGSVYFYKVDANGNYDLSRLKLQFDKIIEKPRVVEYDKKYYIKPENEDFVLEFDYKGNFIEKRKMPDEE